MAWQGKVFQVAQGPDAINAVADHFSGLGDVAATTAKIAVTDARHDAARGFIFWNEDYEDKPVPKIPKGHWTKVKQFNYNADDFTPIVPVIAQYLNELESDSHSKAFWAKLVACDSKYHSGHLALITAA